ncbi:MAG: DUF1854 domain-containing protein [Saccharofermentanales bacterium]
MSNDGTADTRPNSTRHEDAEYNSMISEQLAKVDSLFEIRMITPDNSAFARTEGGFLSLIYDGKEYSRVAVYRAFPFTSPLRYISIRDITPKCEEIGMIRDLTEWPDGIRAMIDEQLNLRYFTPKILEINDIKEEYGFAYWTVRTDRGEMRFTTSIWNPIFRIGDKKLLVNDLDSNRFEIDDVNQLSRKEMKMIDLFL